MTSRREREMTGYRLVRINCRLGRMKTVPFLHHSGRRRRHAVDRHVHVAVAVADRNAEPAEISSDDLDAVVGRAGQLEGLLLAPVLSLVPRTVRSNACKSINE